MTAPFGLVVALVLLPVAARHLRRFRGTVLLAIVVSAAAVVGYLLTEASIGPTSTSLLGEQTLRILSLPAILTVLLWSRAVIGVRRLSLYYGIGLLANLGIVGISSVNPWKFSFALPATLIVLSLHSVYRRQMPQLIAVLALAVTCVVFDSRSAAGFLLVSAALALMSARRSDLKPRKVKTAAARFLTAVQLAAVAFGAYFMLQGAILEGMMGDEIRVRSEAQIAASGSLLAGGRPEMGATFALISHNPWGFGSGATPTMEQILVAKEGMAKLGYDPNNGYVENYMFGVGFEVHSIIGDLWLQFGPLGGVIAMLCLFQLVRGMTNSMGLGVASAIAIYVATRSVWDMAFSPLYTSFSLLPLALALVAVPIATLKGPEIESRVPR